MITDNRICRREDNTPNMLSPVQKINNDYPKVMRTNGKSAIPDIGFGHNMDDYADC